MDSGAEHVDGEYARDRRPGHALVVGGSSAIGRAIGRELAGLGHSVSLWGRDPGRLHAAAEACRTGGAGAVTADVVDVTRDDLAAAVARVSARGPLAVVVWAAGRFDWAPADQAEPTVWADVLEVNLVATARLTPLVLPLLIAAAPSALVYLGSTAASQVFPGNAAYVASKHGLAGLAGSTFLDVRDRGVKVSLISPGLVAAGAGLGSPAGRERPEQLLQPEDVAAAVRFVVTFPARGCPTEIRLQPQLEP